MVQLLCGRLFRQVLIRQHPHESTGGQSFVLVLVLMLALVLAIGLTLPIVNDEGAQDVFDMWRDLNLHTFRC